MFSTTIKRSVATLGVVAGLLAAAVPASAMVGGDEADTVTGKAAVLTDYDRNSFSPQAPTSDGLIAVTVDAGSGNDNVKGPTKATAGGISGYEMTKAIAGKAPTNAGTQVGSEALALDDYGPHVLTLDGASSEVFELNTFGGDDTLKVETEVTDYLADAGTGHDKLLIGKDSTHFHDGTSNTVQFAETGRSDAKTPSLIAKGTQVGSEGVKAPVVVLIGANDYGFTEGNDLPCRCDTEARIGGKMHLEDISLGIRGDA